MLTMRKAADRGVGRVSWLDSRHTFSFADYFDPEEVGFSDLLVINDDRVQPSGGFGNHPHRDMEIFSYVLQGALAHKDNLGNGAVSYPGDVQMMSAGTGVYHSEYNASDSDRLHFLQIWIVPNRRGVQPRYHQRHFSAEEKRGRLKLIISPDGEPGTLPIYQDARVYAGLFDDGESTVLPLAPNRYAYVHTARGAVTVNGTALQEGDGARLRNERELVFDGGRGAEVLVFDLRPIDTPVF